VSSSSSKDQTDNGAETIELSGLSNEEVTRRLRAKGEPIRLFGETEKQRRIRLRALEVIEERTEVSFVDDMLHGLVLIFVD
jgi:pre-mRNA-splicing factor 18